MAGVEDIFHDVRYVFGDEEDDEEDVGDDEERDEGGRERASDREERKQQGQGLIDYIIKIFPTITFSFSGVFV